MGKRIIYFDHNATTPLDPQVRDAMLPFLGEVFGNPSSIHSLGRLARAFLDDARERMAVLWRCKPSEIVFTSGGTESNNLALVGAARMRAQHGRHIIVSAIEHAGVLGPLRSLAGREGFECTILGTDSYGRIDPEEVKRAFRTDTILVSIMAANNEIGTLQPVREIAQLCQQRGVLLHTDAVQWFGKEPLPAIDALGADIVSGCAHKLYGPKGAGVLYVRSPLALAPILRGGSQENERRAGTENLAAIAGLVSAWERFTTAPVFDRTHLEPLSSRLEALCTAIAGVRRWGPPIAGRLANTVAMTVEGCDSVSLLAGLDLEGICASSGSACSVGSLEPSHVLLALGATASQASSLVRFSLGRQSTEAEVEATADAFARVVARVRNSGNS
jgi:cysteine desulfurase